MSGFGFALEEDGKQTISYYKTVGTLGYINNEQKLIAEKARPPIWPPKGKKHKFKFRSNYRVFHKRNSDNNKHVVFKNEK